MQEIAEELVVLYRQRLATPGHAFPLDTPWQHEVEEAFPYEETPDQLRAIEEVKADMERSIPMDRLVCGDVGYGKTEIAVRAAFKAVQDGKQVMVLVPTTLLASQHGQTFRERFANYPVRVEVLSRFLSPREQAGGRARPRSRRGRRRDRHAPAAVRRREGAEALGCSSSTRSSVSACSTRSASSTCRANVDVLTLTATPIPRTLELSLTGIRDLSLVNTPPEDRQPILTYVGEYDDQRRRRRRSVASCSVKARCSTCTTACATSSSSPRTCGALVPEARVAVAHGQMDESRLERVVQDFWEHEYDVLVCTTIIESGLDMPTVNTLVVDRSDLLGLAQLYQLRGRVGRRGQRAYAYLFHPADRVLSEEAYERLKTIGEFTDLGSGFKIAMRDLEIRGAGNLLGAAQSGHIAAVGFDLYCQMVTEAVGALKGEPIPEPLEITVDVPVDANLPRDYVARDDVRMEAYRRLAAVTDPADVDDVRAEWEDRVRAAPGGGDRAARRGAPARRVRAPRHPRRSPCSATPRGSPGWCSASRRRCGSAGLAPKAVAKDDDEIAIPLSVKPADVALDAGGAARRRSCRRMRPGRRKRPR